MKRKKIKALSLFREGKDSEISDELEETGEENHINIEDLVLYENWTKK